MNHSSRLPARRIQFKDVSTRRLIELQHARNLEWAKEPWKTRCFTVLDSELYNRSDFEEEWAKFIRQNAKSQTPNQDPTHEQPNEQ